MLIPTEPHDERRSAANTECWETAAEGEFSRSKTSITRTENRSLRSWRGVGGDGWRHSRRCPPCCALRTQLGHRARSEMCHKLHTTGLMHRSKQHRYSRQLRLARDEHLPSHSITSLAVANNIGGKSSPSDLAVARLSTKSNLVIW